MSTAAHDAFNIPDAVIGNDQYLPRPAPKQESQGMSTFADSSGPILSMYLDMAAEEDNKMVENWKADADGILIFTGLFSAAVASFISVSIQDIRPNPQDTSNFYLANIYQTVADPNGANVSSSASLPPFSPPSYAVWVNTLWFMSLVISLTCALLATPHKRARIRSFFAEGVDKLLLSWTVEALPTLLHISLFLFFGGLVVFLSNIDLTTFKWVLSWVGACTALYGCITLAPIVRHDSPYYTPLSLPVWHIVTGLSSVTFWVLAAFSYLANFSTWVHDFVRSAKHYHQGLKQGMQKTAEETARNLPSEIDARAFMSTFDSLDEDHELERFFSGLPGLRNSKVVGDPLPSLTREQNRKLSTALLGLLERTFSSDLLSESIKSRRAIICTKAIDPVHTPHAFRILDMILSNHQDSGPVASAIMQIARGWVKNKGENAIVNARAAISMIVARLQPRDDSWFILASDVLGIPESVLRNHATHGDSLSFANLIHLTRQQFSNFWEVFWFETGFSEALEAASDFDVQNTSPELQHEFCALWNQIVHEAQNDDDQRMAWHTLRPIRDVYQALHQHTDSVPTRSSSSTIDYILFQSSSYPLCKVASHTHNDSASTIDNTAPAPASLASPNASSSSVHITHRVDESLTDVLLLDNDICGPGSFHPAHQTATEPPRILTTSSDSVTARVIRGGTDTSTTMIPLSILEPSLSTPPPTLMASSPGAIAVQNRTTSARDVLYIPSLPSPTPVLDHMLPTDPQLSLNTPVTVSNHALSPESRSLLSVTPAAPGPSRPRLPSAPDLVAAAEGEGSAKAASHKVLDPPSAVRDNIMASPDLPPRSPSPSLGAEYTGDPPHPSHGQYDIV